MPLDNDDLDARFAALVEGLELHPEPGVPDVSRLSDRELGAMMQRVRAELEERHEMHHPTTERARELHSLRAAIVIETNDRIHRQEVGDDGQHRHPSA